MGTRFFSYFFILLIWGSLCCAQTILQTETHELEIPKAKVKSKFPFNITGAAIAYGGILGFIQHEWYKDSKQVAFHFYNDGRDYLQIDKLGHAWSAYIESYATYPLLINSGMSEKKALLWSSFMGLILQTPIEIFDGLYEDWGFSAWDTLANFAGSLLFTGQEHFFGEQLIQPKFSFMRSPYADESNSYLGTNFFESFVYDYNGHTYWFSMNINKIVRSKKIPSWLSVSLGYSANGLLGEVENLTYFRGVALPQYERYRQFFLSLDVDFTKIKTRSKFLRTVLKGITFLKFPFPTLEYNSQGTIRFHWIYY